jgi:hypothetical protein
VIWKSLGVLLVLFILTACGLNVEPGDTQYPVLNKSRKRSLDITLIQAPRVQAIFPVRWYGEDSHSHERDCTYWGSAQGVPARLGYSITVPLLFTGAGTTSQSQFAFDMYEPGLCGYKFVDLFYRVDPGYDGLKLDLILYKDNHSLPNETSVDLWCYPVGSGSAEDWCDSMRAASIQNINRAEQYRIPRLPTPEQAAAAKANGDMEPPALVGPNTRSLIIRVHDARINLPAGSPTPKARASAWRQSAPISFRDRNLGSRNATFP